MPVLETAWERGRVELLNLSPDPTVRHTVWSQALGGCFIYCSLYAVNQAQVQRLLSLPTLSAGQTALWLQVPILTLLSLSTSLAGLCILQGVLAPQGHLVIQGRIYISRCSRKFFLAVYRNI